MDTNEEATSTSRLQREERPDASLWKQIQNKIVSVVTVFLNVVQLVMSLLVFLTQRVGDEVIATEHMFLLMTNLYAFICQFFFFTLCDMTLLKLELKHKRGKILSGLTTLLLYSIFTYFAAKIRDTFRHAIERSTRGSRSRAHFMRAMKAMLEFFKAAIVIICLREQGLQYHFDVPYSTTTFIYYICTEKVFVDGMIYFVRLFSIDALDGLEHLYVPIVLHSITILLTFAVLGMLVVMGTHNVYAMMSSYFTLYLPIKDLVNNYLKPLMLEKRTFASFRVADEKELARWDDICAVCLERMSKARITPCNHFFHPQCLKRCLQTSMQCPLCKNDFVTDDDDDEDLYAGRR